MFLFLPSYSFLFSVALIVDFTSSLTSLCFYLRPPWGIIVYFISNFLQREHPKALDLDAFSRHSRFIKMLHIFQSDKREVLSSPMAGRCRSYVCNHLQNTGTYWWHVNLSIRSAHQMQKSRSNVFHMPIHTYTVRLELLTISLAISESCKNGSNWCGLQFRDDTIQATANPVVFGAL